MEKVGENARRAAVTGGNPTSGRVSSTVTEWAFCASCGTFRALRSGSGMAVLRSPMPVGPAMLTAYDFGCGGYGAGSHGGLPETRRRGTAGPGGEGHQGARLGWRCDRAGLPRQPGRGGLQPRAGRRGRGRRGQVEHRWFGADSVLGDSMITAYTNITSSSVISARSNYRPSLTIGRLPCPWPALIGPAAPGPGPGARPAPDHGDPEVTPVRPGDTGRLPGLYQISLGFCCVIRRVGPGHGLNQERHSVVDGSDGPMRRVGLSAGEPAALALPPQGGRGLSLVPVRHPADLDA
jgi:hypothetical protein